MAYDFPTLTYTDWRPRRPGQNALVGTLPASSNALISLGTLEQGGGPGIGGGGAQLGMGMRGDVPGPDDSTTETDNAMDAINGMMGMVSAMTGNPISLANTINSIVNNTPVQNNLDFLTTITDHFGLTNSITDALRGLPDPNDMYGYSPANDPALADTAPQVGIGGVDPGIEGFGGVDNGFGGSDVGGIGGPAGTGGNDGPDGGGPGGSGTGGQWRGGYIEQADLHGPNPPGPDDGFTALDVGEYVVRADAVRKYGRNFLNALNRGEVTLNDGRSGGNALRRLPPSRRY